MARFAIGLLCAFLLLPASAGAQVLRLVRTEARVLLTPAGLKGPRAVVVHCAPVDASVVTLFGKEIMNLSEAGQVPRQLATGGKVIGGGAYTSVPAGAEGMLAQIDGAAMAMAEQMMPEGQATEEAVRTLAVNELNGDFGFTEDLPVVLTDAPALDGAVVLMNASGDPFFLLRGDMPTEEFYELVKKYAIQPSGRAAASGTDVLGVSYTNGMQTRALGNVYTAQRLADATGAPTVGVLNATNGFRDDLSQVMVDRAAVNARAVLSKVGLVPPTLQNQPSADTVAEIVEFTAKQGNVHNAIAHSQGGADMALGLQRARARMGRGPAGLGHVDATFLGSASPWVPRGVNSALTLVNSRDPVPTLFGVGGGGLWFKWKDRLYNGPNGQVIRFSGTRGEFEPVVRNSLSPFQYGITPWHDVNQTYVPAYLWAHRAGLVDTAATAGADRMMPMQASRKAEAAEMTRQCLGMTVAGAQCQRSTRHESGFCPQHRTMSSAKAQTRMEERMTAPSGE